jgi:type IV pilus assembly protein PilQ
MVRGLGILIAAVLGCGGAPQVQDAPAREVGWDLDLDAPRPHPATKRPPAERVASPRARNTARPNRARSRSPFRGKPIDIDLKGAELHDVFRLLADVSGANIVVSDEVKGRVTLRLRRVPWDQVLYTVVKVKRLALHREHGIWRVMPREATP